MKSEKTNTTVNLFFSAFLIIAFVICSYFFSAFAENLGGAGSLIRSIVFIVFGSLIFYATRVGDGKSVRRFSIVTLLVLDIPALLILLAGLVSGMPLHDQLISNYAVLPAAATALGYGLPYTFLSGFELGSEGDDKSVPIESKIIGDDEIIELSEDSSEDMLLSEEDKGENLAGQEEQREEGQEREQQEENQVRVQEQEKDEPPAENQKSGESEAESASDEEEK